MKTMTASKTLQTALDWLKRAHGGEGMSEEERWALIEDAMKIIREKLATSERQAAPYSIHRSLDGTTLIERIELDPDQIESLSAETAEGHFRAGEVDELTRAGINPDTTVYAIVL